jgi:hypothetical protein
VAGNLDGDGKMSVTSFCTCCFIGCLSHLASKSLMIEVAQMQGAKCSNLNVPQTYHGVQQRVAGETE